MTGTAYSPVAAGSPGPLERKMPSGCMARMSSALAVAGTTVTLALQPRQKPQYVALDAVIDRDDVHGGVVLRAIAFVPDPGRLGPGRGLARSDLPGQIETDKAAPGGGARLQRADIEAAVRRMREHRVGHALVADERGQRARVDAAHGDDAAPFQPGVEMHGRAMVRRVGEVGLEDGAHRAGAGGRIEVLDVFLVGRRHCRYGGR